MHAVHACRRFIDDVSCVRAVLAEPSLIDECSVSAQHFNSAPSRNHVCPFRPGWDVKDLDTDYTSVKQTSNGCQTVKQYETVH